MSALIANSIYFLTIGLTIFAIVQTLLVIGFVRRGKTDHPAMADSVTKGQSWPEARVVLCVRGADPSLPECLQALLALDYPNYRLIVVADSADDPAWSVIDRVAPHESNLLDRVILDAGERLDSCSLKCSSLIRACRDLPHSVQVVALVDADTLPQSDWLKGLVEPLLRDSRIGVTTGVRWYNPLNQGMASRVRAVWNAAAIVQMWAYSIPWGGSMAVRRRVLDEAGLLERWTETFCEDTPTTATIRPFGWQVATIKSLVLHNREACRWRDLVPWISRQLLTARLHHPAWPLVAAHGVLSFTLPLALLVASVLAMIWGQWSEAWAATSFLVLYELAMVALVAIIGWGLLRGKKEGNLAPKVPIALSHSLMSVPAVILSQAVHPWALLLAIAKRRVVWRQIPYRMLRRGRIKRDGYEPYVASPTTSAESL